MYIDPDNLTMLHVLSDASGTDLDELMSLAMHLGCDIIRGRAGFEPADMALGGPYSAN